jgi:hypothetical protein
VAATRPQSISINDGNDADLARPGQKERAEYKDPHSLNSSAHLKNQLASEMARLAQAMRLNRLR